MLAALKTKPPAAVARPTRQASLDRGQRPPLLGLRSGQRNGAPIEQRNWIFK